MFGNSKEYHDIQKLYFEKVSKPEQLDELKTGPGPNTPPKKTTSFGDAIKANQNRSATTTSTPKMSTSGAQITTNQRQSRDLASKNKDVKLNKFSRTKTYGADAKGVKLVPGAKVGQQVNRSTVQTKAEFDFGGVKKGERLGVMTRNQRRKYDLMAAQRAKKNEPKPNIKPIDANPFEGEPKKEPVENKGKVIRGQGGRPLGSTTRRQGGSVKDGKKLFIDKDKAKAYTDKTGKASQVVSKDELVKRTSRAPIFQSFGKSRQLQSQGKNPQTVMSRDTKRQIADLEGNKDDKKEKTLTTQQKMRQKLRDNRNRMREAYASIYNQPVEPENIDETKIDEGAAAALQVGAKVLPKIPGALKAIGAGAATGAGALKLKNVFKSKRIKGSAIPDADDEFIRSSEGENSSREKYSGIKTPEGPSKAGSGQGEIKIGKVTITKKDPKTGKIIKKQKRDKRSELMGQGSRTGGNSNYFGDHYEYEPYDIVLEYLLSSQQAATIEEANYIMTEMDAKTIQDIVAQQLNEQN